LPTVIHRAADPLDACRAHRSVLGVDVGHGLGEGFRGFLRKVVPDAARWKYEPLNLAA
jgi:hypothetical protein